MITIILQAISNSMAFRSPDPNPAYGYCYEEIEQWLAKEDEDEDWITLSDEWDLNLYYSDEGEIKATLYPVNDGETDVQNFVVIK